MSIKSDQWILRMCEEQQLITPFEHTLIRKVDDRRIISCGLSSYGYDCRLAKDEFKVFSPIQGTEIDPKNFNPDNLLDIPLRTGDDGSIYWLLPPHSYALGVTIEHFNMPRNVTAIALGKSTYARCFRGDTRVALANGTTPTLEEMARRADEGEMFWGYSLGEYGRIEVTLLDAPRFIGRDSLLQVTLDNGETIHCTPDHVFIRRDGATITAGELRSGDSLMPLYRKLVRGYEAVYQPLNGHLYPTHRLADEWKLRNGLLQEVPAGFYNELGNGEAFGLVQQPLNHKVVAVEEMKGDHDVYCLTVPEAGNFALAAGVFVHNCGLIQNTTPLEAAWSGRLVVELYNAANLPVRLYAEEGFVQILFFESDEECRTSYLDRGGKYQNQTGLTLAKL